MRVRAEWKFAGCLVAVLAVVLAGVASGAPLDAQSTIGPHRLAAVGDHFELDGKPFQIVSGAIHYARVPRAYWRDRLKKARAMGLNTVETYVFWNLHEPEPGRYDFADQNDVAEFVREAGEEGLHVILRPGPYVCAEWEFGGYPAWLLRDPQVVVRSQDARFMAAAERWLKRLGEEMKPLMSANGGPIFAVQAENEYGSFGADHVYMERMRKILEDAGFGAAMLYTADGADELANGSLPTLPAAINFGSGEAKNEFAKLAKLRPGAPRMAGEYWDGWFDHWGEKHHTTDAKAEAAELEWMLGQGISVNLYMAHGGTSFGWMNGANIDDGKYNPDVTSYDYDVPIGEQGELREKFFLFRDVVEKVTGVKPPSPPAAIVARAFDAVKLEESAALMDTLPAADLAEKIPSMEEAGQAYGYILYRTQSHKAMKGELAIDGLHDYALVFAGNRLVATLDRRKDESKVSIDTREGEGLQILVENTGRVNFGHQFPQERAGIAGRVTLNGEELHGWSYDSLPMDRVDALPFQKQACEGQCFARGILNVDKPTDTFLDMRGFGKGMVFVNGRALGRFWHIGPQQTLYLPAPWLHTGANSIVVFDLETKAGRQLKFLDHPVLDERN